MPAVVNAVIKMKTEIAPGIFRFVVEAGEVARAARPGQFVHLGVEGHSLRRPISLAAIDPRKEELTLIMEIRGEGTALLCQKGVGDCFDLLGPLGHGFDLLERSARAVIIGGGIGVPPLLPLGVHYGANASVILGFRTQSAMILTEEFKEYGCGWGFCTDDGSFGEKGLVTAPLARLLEVHIPDIIYACGPGPMLKGVATLALEKDIRCQVSMEQRMGCGIGACLTCACPTKTAGGDTVYRHVCQYGPVFEAKEVAF